MRCRLALHAASAGTFWHHSDMGLAKNPCCLLSQDWSVSCLFFPVPVWRAASEALGLGTLVAHLIVSLVRVGQPRALLARSLFNCQGWCRLRPPGVPTRDAWWSRMGPEALKKSSKMWWQQQPPGLYEAASRAPGARRLAPASPVAAPASPVAPPCPGTWTATPDASRLGCLSAPELLPLCK